MGNENPFLDLPDAVKTPSSAADVVVTPGQPTRMTVRPQGASNSDAGTTTSNPFLDLPDAPKKPTTATESFGRGVTRGATFNFQDELEGLAAAGGLAPDDPNVLNAAVALAKGGYKKIIGDPEAEKAFADQVAKSRALNAQQQAEHPVAATAGQVVGALAVPVGAGVQAATIPARVGRSAAVGAGVGAVSGAGDAEGNIVERAPETAKGAGIGAVAGAVAVPALAAIEAGMRRLAEPLTNIWRGLREPEAEAGRRVATALHRDIQNTGAPSLSRAEFQAAQRADQPVGIMDLGGETTRAVARQAANVSPEARDVLATATNERFASQGDRLAEWLRYRFNFPDAHAQAQAVERTARTTNRANYTRAYQDGAEGLWSPELERLASSDAVSSAMQRAVKSASDEAVVSGHGAMNPRITFTPDGRMQFNRAPNGMPTYPDLQYWDQVRREISDAAQRAGRGTEEARRLNRFATALNGELDRLVPSYHQARSTAAGFFGADNALEAGQAFVGSSGRLGHAASRDALARMSPTERALFQDGYVSRMIQRAENAPDRRNILGTLANSRAAREEIELALGPARARELEAWLRVEEIMQRGNVATNGNSTTVRQLIESGIVGGGVGSAIGVGADLATGQTNPQHLIVAALLGAATRHGQRMTTRAVDERVARHVADLLVSQNPRDLSRGIQILGNRPNLLQALRAADPALARSGAEQAARVPALEAMGSGRADENKKNVPRPAAK